LALVSIGAALVLAAAAHGEDLSREAATLKPAASDTHPATSSQPAGQRVYIDPTTGKVGVPPAGAAAPSAAGGAATTAAPAPAPLAQQAVASPAGGVMVDLEGRFRREVRAQVQPDGKVTTECVPAEPRP
jgi:hypothetical protein